MPHRGFLLIAKETGLREHIPRQGFSIANIIPSHAPHVMRKPLRGNATCTLCAICLIIGGLPDGERVMFFMCDTRNLTIYNHLDQEGRRITICPVGALS